MSRAFFNDGSKSDMRIEMIAITTSSSISVKGMLSVKRRGILERPEFLTSKKGEENVLDRRRSSQGDSGCDGT